MNKNLKKIYLHRQDIKNSTANRFKDEIEIFYRGISLLLDVSEILEHLYPIQDRKTSEGASQSAAWRFLSTSPTSSLRSFECALEGDFSIAKHILRLNLEETLKLAYYAVEPKEALRVINLDRDNDGIRFSELIKALELSESNGLGQLYGQLSNLYTHANLNVTEELVREKNGEIYIAGGPVENYEIFEAILQQLLMFIANIIKYLPISFPLLLEESWFLSGAEFVREVIDLLPKK